MKLFIIFILISQYLVFAQLERRVDPNRNPLGKENTGQEQLWTIINTHNLETDPELQSLLKFGVEYLISQGLKTGRLPPNQTYSFKKANYIDTHQGTNTVIFFDVNLQSDQDPKEIRALVEIHYVPGTNTREITYSCFLRTIYAGGNGPHYFNLSWSKSYSRDEFNDDYNLQNILTFSVPYVIRKGVESGALPNSRYSKAELYIMGNEFVNETNYYQINIGLFMENFRFVEANYIVKDQPKEGKREVMSYNVYIVLEEPPSKVDEFMFVTV